jgi:hypothetical protein|eukprot:COSAG06_NODE_16999_length_967_cov_97.202627_2_plen_49_part_00
MSTSGARHWLQRPFVQQLTQPELTQLQHELSYEYEHEGLSRGPSCSYS